MIQPHEQDGGSISIDHLIALNEEIAALWRAGMPLERGLLGFGGDLPGRLGAIATRLSQRMEAGSSLAEAMAAEGANLPASYRAVVEAGMRSGRLATALEGLAGFARAHLEMRRAVGLALLYPVIVLLLGYGLFVAMLILVIPQLIDAFASLRVPTIAPLRALARMGNHAWAWGPILPAFVVAGAAAWVISGRAGRMGMGLRMLRWLPGMRGIERAAVAAQFADWLAMMVEHGVPWGEAVGLAARASGDPSLVAMAGSLAESSRRGESIAEGMRGHRGLPPLLRWMMASGQEQGSLASALHHAADTYRRRAMRQAANLRAILPAALLLAIGGTTTLLYALTLFVPWTTLLYKISR